MRKFKVTIEGQTYDVLVEEVADKSLSPTSPAIERTVSTPPLKKVVNDPVNLTPLTKKTEKTIPTGGSSVPAPMPGSVIEVRVKSGDAVAAGDVLLILEAMKMENEITATVGGTITKVMVKDGDTVNSGDPLVYIA